MYISSWYDYVNRNAATVAVAATAAAFTLFTPNERSRASVCLQIINLRVNTHSLSIEKQRTKNYVSSVYFRFENWMELK